MTQPGPAHSSNGFSLIELMISVVIIMISMLAVLTAILKSTNTNLQNELRNTAIRITNQTAEALLALPISDSEVSATTGTTRIAPAHSRTDGDATQDLKGLPKTTVSIRGARTTYTITWDVTATTDNVKQINITVGYTYRSQPVMNSAIVYKHKAI